VLNADSSWDLQKENWLLLLKWVITVHVLKIIGFQCIPPGLGSSGSFTKQRGRTPESKPRIFLSHPPP
jgi:hypothetical protein